MILPKTITYNDVLQKIIPNLVFRKIIRLEDYYEQTVSTSPYLKISKKIRYSDEVLRNKLTGKLKTFYNLGIPVKDLKIILRSKVPIKVLKWVYSEGTGKFTVSEIVKLCNSIIPEIGIAVYNEFGDIVNYRYSAKDIIKSLKKYDRNRQKLNE